MAILDWTTAAMESVNSDPAFKLLGSADIDIVLQSGKYKRRVCFRDFGVESVDDCSEENLVDEGLVISMPTVSWNSYLHKRRIGVGPSLQSLNLEKSVVHAKNAMSQCHFDRVHRSIQAFIDCGARAKK